MSFCRQINNFFKLKVSEVLAFDIKTLKKQSLLIIFCQCTNLATSMNNEKQETLRSFLQKRRSLTRVGCLKNDPQENIWITYGELGRFMFHFDPRTAAVSANNKTIGDLHLC